jgi:GNAT superfamily N-acetyltransferase
VSAAFDIRLFDPCEEADFVAAVTVIKAVSPDTVVTAKGMREQDARREAKCRHGRWLAFRGGEPVGYAVFSQSSWAYDPRHFSVRVKVSPVHERHGIGRALYSELGNALQAHQPTQLHTSVREDCVRGARFAADNGYAEVMREWESRLDVASFDPSFWEEARGRPGADGIAVRSYVDLDGDPDRDVKLHGLISRTFVDVPSTVPLTPPALDIYREQILRSSAFLPEGLLIAVDEATGDYVASSEVKRAAGADYLDTGLTAVLPNYRRKGIALALKLGIIDVARSIGAREIRTENATTNRPMLAINEALGFVKQPASISLTKHLD